MELPVLDKFCFIFDLKSGCLSMGIINSILTFILAIILITFAVDLQSSGDAKNDGAMGGVVYTIVILLVVLLFVKFLLELVFIYAVYKIEHLYQIGVPRYGAQNAGDITSLYGQTYSLAEERCSIMKKYCIFWVVFLVLFVIGFLKALFHMAAGHVIAQILFLAENFYFIVVIRSYLISRHEDGVM